MKREIEFEIVDRYGGRHRFKRSQGYSWAWRLKPGTIDVDGTEFVDVFRYFAEGEDEDSEGYELFTTFPKPALVGDVDEDTCLAMPFRELQLEQCPRCGFTKKNTQCNK